MTAAEVTAGSITYLDKKDEALLEDVELYTNVTQESESQENSTPPHSLDIDTYKGHTFYSNIRRKHAIDILLDDIGEINNGQIIRLTDGSTNLDYKAADAYDLGELEYQNFTTEVTSSQNNEQTARSLVRLINADPSNTLCYAFYTSGPEDRPGKIRIVRRDFSTTPITFEAVSSGPGMRGARTPKKRQRYPLRTFSRTDSPSRSLNSPTRCLCSTSSSSAAKSLRLKGFWLCATA